MPNVFVFPGGRVETEDSPPSGFDEALAPPPTGLDGTTRRRLPVFARAALRETYEETGLLVGAAVPGLKFKGTARGEVWSAFDSAGLAPAFGALRPIARAITPSDSPIRFHTRFFLADGALARGEFSGDGELEDLTWVPIAMISSLPMAEVSLLVLAEAIAHRGAGPATDRPAALFRWVGPGMRPRFAQAPLRPGDAAAAGLT
jgi:8-oxo-dGTP pyrophosphatase MutT (NUDIX family)